MSALLKKLRKDLKNSGVAAYFKLDGKRHFSYLLFTEEEAMVKVKSVIKNSIAHKKGILSGDLLVSINDANVADVLDYRFFVTEKELTLQLVRDGSEYKIMIKKPQYDDIGLEFETYLMDEKRHCKNACIFCFIDQNPKGMRETIYFKDDDERLSFLFGNYIKLKNHK